MVEFKKKYDIEVATKYNEDDELKTMTIKVKCYPKDFKVSLASCILQRLATDAIAEILEKHEMSNDG